MAFEKILIGRLLLSRQCSACLAPAALAFPPNGGSQAGGTLAANRAGAEALRAEQ